jgi:hypothetical protein
MKSTSLSFTNMKAYLWNVTYQVSHFFHNECMNIINNSYYIDTFGLFEGCDARAITIQSEQYVSTVHLFIGTCTTSFNITFMPL